MVKKIDNNLMCVIEDKIIDYINDYIHKEPDAKKLDLAFNRCLHKLGVVSDSDNYATKMFDVCKDLWSEGEFEIMARLIMSRHYCKEGDLYIELVKGKMETYIPKDCTIDHIIRVLKKRR